MPPTDFARPGLRFCVAICCAALLAACGAPSRETAPDSSVEGYGAIIDDGYRLPAVPVRYLTEPNRKTVVDYNGDRPPGSIEIDPHAKFLYYVQEDGRAIRYPIAVGRQGRSLSGRTVIRRQADWPSWTPTKNMLRTQPEVYGAFARGIPGGLRSPLGARALYLYRGNRDTHFRIHGTNDLNSIGNSGSAGCIRLFNQDIIDLAERVENGTTVVIRTLDESIALEGPELANRGVELQPNIIDPELIYGDAAVAADRRIDEIPTDG